MTTEKRSIPVVNVQYVSRTEANVEKDYTFVIGSDGVVTQFFGWITNLRIGYVNVFEVKEDKSGTLVCFSVTVGNRISTEEDA